MLRICSEQKSFPFMSVPSYHILKFREIRLGLKETKYQVFFLVVVVAVVFESR